MIFYVKAVKQLKGINDFLYNIIEPSKIFADKKSSASVKMIGQLFWSIINDTSGMFDNFEDTTEYFNTFRHQIFNFI